MLDPGAIVMLFIGVVVLYGLLAYFIFPLKTWSSLRAVGWARSPTSPAYSAIVTTATTAG